MSQSPRRATASTAAASTTRNDWVGATFSEMGGVRYLHLDSEWVQGAMRIKEPNHLELAYIQRMCAWMLWRASEDIADGAAVQLGLGAGALTRFSALVLGMPTTVVELNPTVIQANHLWFRLPARHPLLTVAQADAGAWVHAPRHHASAHLLQVDLYDHEADAPVLDSLDFYADCRRVLVPGGLMAVNLFGRAASYARSSGHIAEAFGGAQVWSLRPTREGNTVVIAGNGVAVPERDALLARAAHIEQRWKLPARKWLRMVRPWGGAP